MDTSIQPRPAKARVRANPLLCFLNEGRFSRAYDVLWNGDTLFIGFSFDRAYALAAEISAEVGAV